MSQPDEAYPIKLRWKAWCTGQVLLPMSIAVVVWPLGTVALKGANAYVDTFSGGDFVLLGAMLFLGQAVDLYCEQRTNARLRGHSAMDTLWFVVLIFTGVLLVSYGFIKVISFVAAHQPPSGKDDAAVITKQCADFSLGMGSFACLSSFVISLLVLRQLAPPPRKQTQQVKTLRERLQK